MAYNDPTLQEIKDRLNIADVISSYIQIKKAGSSFKALCPFHSEKTPSLQISPQKQIWHCFGCGEGGDIFGFVMRYENVDFKEALKILADKAGVQLPQYRPADPREQSEKELLLRINDFASRFYHKILLEDKAGGPALEYLKNRGLTEGTIKQWQIGYAPDDFYALEQALTKKKVSPEDMVKAGVSAKNERGQIYDRFRGRVTFPIFSYMGDVVGFSARILHDDGKSAKYINSPETLIYNKSQTLFGLNFAKDEIRRKDEMVIVEGQMDCISLQQAGFKNVIASSGIAYNEQAVAFTLAHRLSKNIKLCFDADSAGQMAVKKAGEMLVRLGFRVKVVVLEQVKDPDELVRKSPGLWEKAVAEAVWFLDLQMDIAEKKFAQDPVAQKHYLSEEVIPLLGAVTDPLEQDHYVRKLMEKFNISERVIRDQINKFGSGKPNNQAKKIETADVLFRPNVLEKEILGGLLVYPEFKAMVLSQIAEDEFEDPVIKDFIRKLLAKDEAAAARETVAKEAVFMVESQRDVLEGGAGQQLRELKKSFALFKVNALKRKQQRLNLDIRQAEATGEKQALEKLNREFAWLSEERMRFEKLT